jgi:hypothetical protein
MGGAQLFDQGFAGFVLEIFEGGSGDAQGQGVGLGFQMAGLLRHHMEHNFAHVGVSLSSNPILDPAAGLRPCPGIRGTVLRMTQAPNVAAGLLPMGGSLAPECALPVACAMTPTREQILAASAGWVAVLLNVLPGLGAGYLYQRRWQAYWITSALATAWFVAGALLAQDADAAAEAQNQLVGLIGLLALAAVTATEAGLAVKRVRGEG